MAMMLLTSAAAIVLTCSAFVAYELLTARRQSQVQTATLARIIAANSTAALAFRDEQDAGEVLAALRTEPNVLAAALYDGKGTIFANYAAPGVSAVQYPSTVQSDGYRFHSGYLEGFESVSEQRDHRLGTLYIRSDMRPLYRRFWLYAAIAAVVMSASLLLAYVLSRLLQRQISGPVLSLAQTARAISERGDFSVRAPLSGEGEFLLVMTDLGMPYVDGRAVAAAVKSLSARTPVLLLTGWGQRLSTEQSVPPNVDLWLSKPPKLPELRRAFAQLLAERGQVENA